MVHEKETLKVDLMEIPWEFVSAVRWERYWAAWMGRD